MIVAILILTAINWGFDMELCETLDAIALGKQWSDSALAEALTKLYLNESEKDVLRRYSNGSQVNMDHVRLQDISITIRNNQ